jgi:putative hydrolase of the HAD superfamily
MNAITTIGFDADDTLWESEIYFADVERKFLKLMETYTVELDVKKHLYDTEINNLERFGYGVKSFTISMIESAHYLTKGKLRSNDSMEIIQWGKDLMRHPVELISGVQETLEKLDQTFSMLIITKGDPLHQQQKASSSGLMQYMNGIEVLMEKDPASYTEVLKNYGIEPNTFLMVGNSLRSDILPVLEIGGHALHVPHELTWGYENDSGTLPALPNFTTLERIADLPEILEDFPLPRNR